MVIPLRFQLIPILRTFILEMTDLPFKRLKVR